MVVTLGRRGLKLYSYMILGDKNNEQTPFPIAQQFKLWASILTTEA
jgi:hypothetical protein